VTAAAMIDVQRFLELIRQAAEKAGVFERIDAGDAAIRCLAKDASAEAWYSIVREGNDWRVRLATADRWLSESIEADLMHHGDPLEELIEEELIDLDHVVAVDGAMPQVKHFRSDDRLYTFENVIAMPDDTDRAATIATRYLLAYEAAFRELGDMQGGDDE